MWEGDEDGQGLVELTLAIPVLIIMFFGLVELGAALRSQLVLVNANREAGRFASRGVFTDEQIAHRALVAVSGQLPVEVTGTDPNTQLIITRFHIPADKSRDATYDKPIYITGTLGHASRIDPDVYKLALKQHNDDFNDELVADQKDAQRTMNDLVVVEMFYHHSQLLNAPVINWIFPEPLPLYSWTTMRIGASRVR
jgi:hypothetical protein